MRQLRLALRNLLRSPRRSLVTMSAVIAGVGVFIVGVTVSALSAYACIALFLRVIERIGFMPFVVYRVILGAVLLYLFW